MTNFIYSTSIDWMLLKPVTVLDDAVVTKTNEKTPTRKLQCREGERDQHPSNQQNIRQSEGATYTRDLEGQKIPSGRCPQERLAFEQNLLY